MKRFIFNGREEIVLFTLEEVAKELGISYRTVRRYVQEGRIPACEIGRNKYIWMQHLGQFLKGAKSTRSHYSVPVPSFDTEDFSDPPDPCYWDEWNP